MRDKKWVCLHCNKVMDKSNFVDFINESDNDKNSIEEAVVEYHKWKLIPSSPEEEKELHQPSPVHPSLV